VYEVEQILKHRKRGRGYKYLIKWVSYLIAKALWEPKSNLTGATDILQEYQELPQL
jgi:Chromo (CHRromatin Organisation MOdifier) domain